MTTAKNDDRPFRTAHQYAKAGNKEKHKMLARLRRIQAEDIPHGKTNDKQWERGRKWLDIVRPKLHAFKHPKDPHHSEKFFQTLPIPDSGSDYIDSICLDLAAAILTRRANHE